MYIRLHVKHPLFSSDLINLNFHDKVSKDTKTYNFTKIHSGGAELFHAEMDMWDSNH
jgi:hypothetical protein